MCWASLLVSSPEMHEQIIRNSSYVCHLIPLDLTALLLFAEEHKY
jgi:hypothetical protein